MEKYSRVYASVNLDAIRSNVEHIRENIAPQTKIIGVIKADGYGHGSMAIAQELESMNCLAGFGVATAEEAISLRRNGIKKPILILGYTFPYSYKEIIRENITPTVFRYDALEGLAACIGNGQRIKVHIKVDTGMSRLGIMPDEEGLAFVKRVLQMPELELEGIFTHFARADEADKKVAQLQLKTFQNFIETIKQETGYNIPICHSSNSAGILGLKEANMHAVRAGIILYGLWPSDEVDQNILPLTPALELKSHIVYIKKIGAGRAISYGGTFTAKRQMKIATIPVGYGDGYPRGLSNRGYILVRGKRAPILGRICMDQFMVDITDIPDVQEGDEVTLIGRDGDECITMELLGKLSGRFNYELACLIGQRVPRVYKKTGEVVARKDNFHDFE